MKIRMRTTASGPNGVFIEGQIVSVPEEISHEDAGDLIPIYAELISGEIVEHEVLPPHENRKAGRPRKT